jgi:sugar lactone lactonase YvrE
MNSEPITVAAHPNCELGENPLWDAERRCVFWEDINGGKIFRLHPASGKLETIYQGGPIGGFTIQQNGELLLFRMNDIAVLNKSGGVRSLHTIHDEGMARFNDVTADPAGRVFAGTIGKTKESGGLFRIDLDGTATKLFAGTGCSNGMGFSPDLKKFYWICSTTRKIFRFDYDQKSGAIENRQMFYATSPEEGIPDGLAVDAEGCVWSARWNGFSIVRHAPDGKVMNVIRFPARNITSLCFAGEKLDEIFVTSSQHAGENSPTAGALFRMKVPVSGMKEFRSKIN